MSVELDQFLNLVRPWAKGCPEPGMQDALVTAAREFAAETMVAQRAVQVSTVATPATQSYAVVAASQEEELLAVMSAQGSDSNGNVWAINPGDPSYWNPGVSPGWPFQHAIIPYTQIALWPVPNAVYTIKLVVAVQPRQGATVLPLELMRKYDRQICDGALARLVSVPNRPWSNPAMIGKYEASFASGKSMAKQDVIRGYNAGSLRARPRAFIV